MSDSNAKTGLLNGESATDGCDAVEAADLAATVVENTNENDQPVAASNASEQQPASSPASSPILTSRKIQLYMAVLFFDALVSIVALAPIWPYIRHMEDASSFRQYKLHHSLVDLAFLAALRIAASVLAIIICYCRAQAPPENPRYDHFDKYRTSNVVLSFIQQKKLFLVLIPFLHFHLL
jgi:hypothetical protein